MMPRPNEEELLRSAAVPQPQMPKRQYPGSRVELLEDELYQAKRGLTADDRLTGTISFISDARSHIDRKIPDNEREKWKALSASIQDDIQKTMEQPPFTNEAMSNADGEPVNQVASAVSGNSLQSNIRETHTGEYWLRIESHVSQIRWVRLLHWVDTLADMCTELGILREQRLERSSSVGAESFKLPWSSEEEDEGKENEDEEGGEK